MNQGERGHSRRIRAQNPRAEGNLQDVAASQYRGALRLVEAAFGTDQHGERGTRAQFDAFATQRRQRIGYGRVLVAEDEQALRIELREVALEINWLDRFRDRQQAALLRRFDRIGAQAMGADATQLGASVNTGVKRDAPISVAFWTM